MRKSDIQMTHSLDLSDIHLKIMIVNNFQIYERMKVFTRVRIIFKNSTEILDIKKNINLV
jgi:hypothetical protein